MQENWEDIRTRVLARDQRACSARFLGGGCSTVLDVHHILPREEGGTDEDENLLTLCHRHHPMMEALRRAILKRRGWRPCPHKIGVHRYPGARETCERTLNRHLLQQQAA